MEVERVMEYVRRQHFLEHPSRVGAVFAWPTLPLARHYAVRLPSHPRYLYVVNLIGNCDGFIGDFQFVTHPERLDVEQAQSYWQGKHDTFPAQWEVVWPGDAEVAELAETL